MRITSISRLMQQIYAIMPRVPLMADTTPVELVYDGEEVKDGSVPVEYMIDTLVGFSSAYSKIARRTEGADKTHRIRLVGLRPNSTHILLDVIEWVKANPAAAGVLVTAGSLTGTGAYKVIKDIAAVFTAKKHLKGAPIENNFIFKNNNIYILNETKQEFHLTKEQLEYLRSGLIDPDLDKITAPLEDQKVEKFELKSRQELLAKAEKAERRYFATSHKPVITTQNDVPLEGTLNSLTKDKKRGTFYTVSGKHIPYQYIGQEEQQLFDAFTHPGTVVARGKVSFDGDLEPAQIQITQIKPVQSKMF